jgi:hypothetical protein
MHVIPDGLNNICVGSVDKGLAVIVPSFIAEKVTSVIAGCYACLKDIHWQTNSELNLPTFMYAILIT